MSPSQVRCWPPPNYNPDQCTGCRVTLADFRQIIADPAWQDIARPLLSEWYGYEIHGERELATVLSSSGDVVDLAALHERIQADPKKQYDLYQRAMNVWR